MVSAWLTLLYFGLFEWLTRDVLHPICPQLSHRQEPGESVAPSDVAEVFGAAPVFFNVPFGVSDTPDIAGGDPRPVRVVAIVLPGHKDVGGFQRSVRT